MIDHGIVNTTTLITLLESSKVKLNISVDCLKDFRVETFFILTVEGLRGFGGRGRARQNSENHSFKIILTPYKPLIDDQ